MGVSFSYTTQNSVAPDIKARVEEDAGRINSSRKWWCESLNFFDRPGREGKIAGDTKLFMVGYSGKKGETVQVDPTDDCFMAGRDARFICDQLARWSRELGLTWILEMADEEIGRITNGRIKTKLFEIIETLQLMDSDDPEALFESLQSAGPPEIDEEQRAREIDEKYAGRNY